MRGVRFEGALLGIGWHSGSVPCLVDATRGTFVVEHERGRVRAQTVFIPAGARHRVLAGSEARFVFWYFDAGCIAWPELDVGAPVAIGKGQQQWLRSEEGRARLLEARGRGGDALVTRALAKLREDVELDLTALSAAVGLSASRFRHRFVDAVGVPLSRYRWWLRLRRAAEAVARGASLTTAAHEAGFADGAHFSRTFRRTFGFSPKALVEAADVRVATAM